jgi:hypothetical protein
VEPLCPAIAVVDGRCAVHARGLRRHAVLAEDENTLRCDRCHRLIRAGEWYRTGAGTTTHATLCIAKESD